MVSRVTVGHLRVTVGSVGHNMVTMAHPFSFNYFSFFQRI